MMKRIAVPITAPFMRGAIADIKEASEIADINIIELRLDCMNDPDLEKLIGYSKIPVIVTNRHADEGGGKFKCEEKERIASLQRACYLKANYVDIELNHFYNLDRKSTTRLIVSYHNFNETPENLDEIYKRIVDKGADIVKIATQANSYDDCERMLDLIKSKHNEKDIIGICMGKKGIKTRIRGPLEGGYLTFACLDKNKASASGQVTIPELKNYWKILKEFD